MKKFSKLLSLTVAGIMVLSGCSSNIDTANNIQDEKVYKIGISQLADHQALDDARRGFEDGLKELGVNAEIDYQNAQGDIPTTITISQKFVKDEVDLIYAIATPAAQSAKQATKDIPILFSAVTDPVVAELVDSMEKPGGNITGTSDASPMDRQLQLFKDLDENIKKIGIIFNTDEQNSQIQVEMAKDLGSSIGLEIIEVGISNISDIPQAVDSIIKKVDGIYTITDNKVASAINIVSEKAKSNKLITVGAEDSHVNNGILITDGISYYELGKQTARMAKEILVDGKTPSEIPSETATNTKKVFNENTLGVLGIDKNNKAFKDATKNH
ncbi:ABC transporter substrate-binding protein [Tissierella pigra]|uniref:ABC transporter substrate-binding protein n=1 Tax=Tissierella pigra TaxID=2607614 RepID=A0A6N7XQS2_9FIRM|nr:ABC transporter substrate-binding protein [Tissierella pigra]MBU5427482.1 ABC transporter substrate-binding protein [Tissierella pigra]MSU03172.1 ABC transporter substrate-binding protein [Tissierella pigra]